jgi:hypothetical protein
VCFFLGVSAGVRKNLLKVSEVADWRSGGRECPPPATVGRVAVLVN